MANRRDFLKGAGALAAVAPLGLSQQINNISLENAGFTNRPADQCSDLQQQYAGLISQIDSLMKEFNRKQGVRASQVAVQFQGCQLMSNGYKNAPASYPEVDGNTLFRLASCTKIFVCAAIDDLSQKGKLKLAQKVFPLLGITGPKIMRRTPSPYINDITVEQLVNHAGGWNDHQTVTAKDGTIIPGTNWDPMFNMREITHRLQLSGAATKRDIAVYMYDEPLQFKPGTQNYSSTFGASYSNFGYTLLGLVIEEVSGQPFADYVRGLASPPLDVYLSRTYAGPVYKREVWYDSLYEGLNALEPHAHINVPYPYGGEGWSTECMDGNGGLMTTAAGLSSFITTHAVWGMGGRANGFAREGSMAGASSWAASLTNGVDFAFIMNSRDFVDGDGALDTFVNDITNLMMQF